MNKVSTIKITCLSMLCFVNVQVVVSGQEIDVHEVPTVEKQQTHAVKKKSPKKNFSFKFSDENLVDIINIVAEKNGANILLPANVSTILSSKVTVSIEDKMSAAQAWDFLIQLLDIAGFSVVPRAGGTYEIVKTTPEVTREPLPIYIGVSWETIPNSEQRVRCVFYLSNIKVPGDPPEPDNELYKVITALMPNGQTGGQETRSPRVAFDPVTNALIIAEKGTVVRSIMEIVTALDTTGFKEKIEILPLFNTVASEVYAIFDEIMKTPQSNPYRLDARKPTTEATYFSKFMRMIPYNRLNTLIILGREQAVDRVKEFIQKYIDVPQDTGQSVFHVYSLQYLDAADFAQILSKIIDASSSGGTGQSRSEGPTAQGGIERMFDGVRITHDRPTDVQGAAQCASKGTAEVVYYGGNRLIVAARHDDWLRIKKLCEELNTPQPQVIIEVLVADLTLDDSRLIGSMLRNPLSVPLPGDMQFQSAQLPPGILVNNIEQNGGLSPATIALDNLNHNNDVDLLRNAYDTRTSQPTPIDTETEFSPTDQSLLATALPGSTAVSLIDPCTRKVWSLLEIRNVLDYNKILTHPHIIAVNNKMTKLVIGEMRLVKDAAVGNQGGNTTVPRKPIPAEVTLQIKPRISLSPDGDPANDTIQLGIFVDISDFQTVDFNISTPQDPSAANRFTRKVITSAHVRNREVIPLGGLIRRESTRGQSQTPLLGQIPIIGYFFKNRQGVQADTNLTIFLCPTVIRPRLRRGGVDRYTRDYVKLSKKYAQEGLLFDSLRDPVTHWFFNTDSDVIDTVNDFISNDEFKQDTELRILTKRSKARQEALKDRLAKEQDFIEMNGQTQVALDDGASKRDALLTPKTGFVSQAQAAQQSARSLAQPASAVQEQAATLSQPVQDLPDKELQLKKLVEHEKNPLLRE